MRQLFAVALVLAVVAAPACAQRGGGRGGGFSGHVMGGGSRGGFSQASHYGYSGYAGGARVQGYRVESRGFAPEAGASATHFTGSGVSNARPVFYTRGRDGRRYRRGFGVPYVYPGWADVGYLGYPYDDYYDDGFYGDEDDSGNGSGYDAGYGPVEDSGAAPENYVEQPPEQYAQQAPDSDESAQSSAEAFAQDTSPALYDSDAVTLVFKDGRPVEKIQNYALTRTTLYVTGAHHREIPVADLDLAATEKANREAGVSFQLPVAQ